MDTIARETTVTKSKAELFEEERRACHTRREKGDRDAVRAIARATRNPNDSALLHIFTLYEGDVRDGALKTVSALLKVMNLVSSNWNVHEDDGPSNDEWDRVHHLAQALCDGSAFIGGVFDDERALVEGETKKAEVA